MRFASLFAAGLLLAGFFVDAAPTTGSMASAIVKRNDLGNDIIDFDFVLRAVKDINQRYATQDTKSLQRRDDAEFIDQLMVELHNHNLLGKFIEELSSTPRLKDAVEKGVLSAISDGLAGANFVLASLRSSGKLTTFFDSVLNDEGLNDELYDSAREILQQAESGDHLAKRQQLEESERLLKALYFENDKRAFDQDNDLYLRQYGMSKRDLVSTVVTIIGQISNSSFVRDIIRSIIGNQSLVSYAINLFGKIFQSINWASLFAALKNSGIIQSVFRTLLSLVTSLFNGNAISNLIGELFGGNSNSSHKSFLATLLGAVVEIGSDLFKGFTSGQSSSGSGLLSEILSTFLGGSGSSSSNTANTSSSSSGSGFLSGLLSSLFGGSSSLSSSLSSSGLGSSSLSSGSSSGSPLADLFNSIFGASSGASSTGASSSGSGSSASGGSSLFPNIIDNLFGNSGLGSSGSGLGGSVTTSTGSSSASSNVFSSKKACCCSPGKIKQRALKRALRKKVKRSVKRALGPDTNQLLEGLVKFFYIN